MIFDELIIHNFGLYRGRQAIRLTPKASRPVVLFGGLNGGGKTTLLDALQLVLYGKFARCSGRGSLSYEDFLRQSINRAVAQEDGAALELGLRRTAGGFEHQYRIHRYWSAIGTTVRESVEIYVDGVFDPVLTDTWLEQVNEFLPVELSPLFFFDGEKIESLANLDNSARVLRTAIQSLLGIDIVARLRTDLLVLERRKVAEKAATPRESPVGAQTDELKRLEREIEEAAQSRASLQNDIERTQAVLTRLDSQFESQGGALFERKRHLDHQRVELAEKLAIIENRLRELAAGPLPLNLLTPLLVSLLAQDDVEQEQVTAGIVGAALKAHNRELIYRLGKAGLPKAALAQMEKIIREMPVRAKKSSARPVLGLERSVRAQADSLVREVLPDLENQCARLLDDEMQVHQQLADLDRMLARIPSPETIEPLIAERARLSTSLTDLDRRREDLDSALERVTRRKAQLESSISEHVNVAFIAGIEDEETQRIVMHSQKARETLDKFETAIIAAHIARIESLVLECLRHLLRKENLIANLTINPETCELSLFGPDKQQIEPERLSAGERQLLAIALLWGLGRAAGRPLPIMIDTPLGRLDSAHRERLVERYFPDASHQVLLLSTDEEIDGAQFRLLKPHISYSYYLDYDDVRCQTTIQEGYFGARSAIDAN